MPAFVQSKCVLSPKGALVNDLPIQGGGAGADTDAFLKDLFRHKGSSYPKFFKMDTLAKLGFLTAELLLDGVNSLSQWPRERCGIVIQNTHSTFQTDVTHLKTISNSESFFPSPAVFVYTLPNIVTGEICIRHKLMGENAVYMVPEYQPAQLATVVELLTGTGLADALICGYSNLQPNGQFLSLLYYIETQDILNRNTIFEADFLIEDFKTITNEWKN